MLLTPGVRCTHQQSCSFNQRYKASPSYEIVLYICIKNNTCFVNIGNNMDLHDIIRYMFLLLK